MFVGRPVNSDSGITRTPFFMRDFTMVYYYGLAKSIFLAMLFRASYLHVNKLWLFQFKFLFSNKERIGVSVTKRSSVIVSAVRTPIGKHGGRYAHISVVDLGAAAISEAIRVADIWPHSIDLVIMGQVLQAGCGQNPARQAAILAGVPYWIPAITVNDVCPSGMSALMLADQIIRAGDGEVIIVGGMESMSRAPILAGATINRTDGLPTYSMVHDGLTCAFYNEHMGKMTDFRNLGLNITRQEQDEWAYRSHLKAHQAWQGGRFAYEVVRTGDVEQLPGPLFDEGIRTATSVEKLSHLVSSFTDFGITPGNASQVSDGAAAMVVMSTRKAVELGLESLARVVSHAMVAGQYDHLDEMPALAIKAALKKARLPLSKMDVLEINEAFASIVVQSIRTLGVNPADVNVNGGAIALGHPLGMTGARLLVTLAHELAWRGFSKYGVAALCGGGGQGAAVVLAR